MEGTIERFYATGKRKESIAKVWVQAGKGEIIVNNKSLKEYFCRESLECIVKHPLIATETLGSVNIKATVKGGGAFRSIRRPASGNFQGSYFN